MTFDCDYAIVGSGFGGSVAALRLAEKGYDVTVLECGKRWRSQDFPKTNWSVRKYLWAPKLLCHGIQRLTLLKDILILSGAGVGGGSLVYANTLLVPPDEAFRGSGWPASVDWKTELAPHYETARRMLGVTRNPTLGPADHALREIAEDLGRGDTFHPTDVGVLFAKDGEKEGQSVGDPFFGGEGPERHTCNHCGGCMVGCRFGAKNTLDKNYLYFAEKRGVRIQPESMVRSIEEIPGGGYALTVERSTALFRKRRRVVRARGVVLSAGVLGTMRLLLKCRAEGKLNRLSPALGSFVRTNSESLLGVTAKGKEIDYSRGIAITSGIFPDAQTHIEPVRYPQGSDAMFTLGTILTDGGGRWAPRWLRWTWRRITSPLDWARGVIPRGYAGRSVILLVMQTIDNHMRLVWRRSKLWPFRKTLTSERPEGQERVPSYIPIANEVARRLATKMDGVARSTINEAVLDIPTTAHILGGCCAADEAAAGVIDTRSRVYGYENLYVCDGSMIPANLGVNPSLTITAMAERAMALVPAKSERRHHQVAAPR